MSYTEIYRITKAGNTKLIGEVKNAWRGAMAVWESLEKAYLPILPRPMWLSENDYVERGFWRTSSPFGDALKPIWALSEDKRLSESERICLLSTFDNVLVLKEDLPRLLKAFREFPYDTSLKEQAEVIEAATHDKHLFAICWNQTSVNGDIPGDKIDDNFWDLFKSLTPTP